MCGICGYSSFKGAFHDSTMINKMLMKLQHRGPDGTGVYKSDLLTMANARLSIIDPKGGQQPIYNEDRSIVLVFNGMIYNYLELRKILVSKGHRFRSNCDTEVVVHLYEEFGHKKCFQMLEGMFAISLWDNNIKKLYLAVDFFGKKPLYYFFSGKEIIFSSELKSIVSHNEISKDIDFSSVQRYLVQEFIPSPNTIYKNVKKLSPRQYIEFDGTTPKISSYMDSRDFFQSNDFQNIEKKYPFETFRELLRASVKKRLISDVKTGIFLSGGMDSTSILALSKEILRDTKLDVFSLYFEEEGYNEKPFIEDAASLYGIEPNYLKIDTKLLLDAIPRVFSIMDEPYGVISCVPQYIIAQFASQSVKVVLAGDGSDELLGGYSTFLAAKYLNALAMTPRFVKKFASNLFKFIPTSFRNESLPFQLSQFFSNLDYEEKYLFQLWHSSFNPQDLTWLLSGDIEKLHIEDLLFNGSHRYNYGDKFNKLSRLSYVYMQTRLADNQLFKIDRMGMANSLEIREPFLDRDLWRFVLSLPDNTKIRKNKGKYLLRESMKNYLPSGVLKRKKQGITMPVARWFNCELKDMLNDTLLGQSFKNRNIFNIKQIKRLISEHSAGKADHRKKLWSLLSLETWLLQNFD